MVSPKWWSEDYHHGKYFETANKHKYRTNPQRCVGQSVPRVGRTAFAKSRTYVAQRCDGYALAFHKVRSAKHQGYCSHKNYGKIEENEGKKRLAYSIKTQSFAVYYFFDVQLPAAAPAKISSTLNITDEVLRYLLVTVDERKAKLEAKRKARKSDEEETTEE